MKFSTQSAVKFAAILGCTALLIATALIVASVIGRHLSIAIPGSVEMVEILIVIIGSTSLLVATFKQSHASARLFIDRLNPTWKTRVEKMGFAMGAVFTTCLLIGTLWIVKDYWSTHEATHLLLIPVIPFRLLFAFTLLVITLLLIRWLFSSNKHSDSDPQ